MNRIMESNSGAQRIRRRKHEQATERTALHSTELHCTAFTVTADTLECPPPSTSPSRHNPRFLPVLLSSASTRSVVTSPLKTQTDRKGQNKTSRACTDKRTSSFCQSIPKKGHQQRCAVVLSGTFISIPRIYYEGRSNFS